MRAVGLPAACFPGFSPASGGCFMESGVVPHLCGSFPALTWLANGVYAACVRHLCGTNPARFSARFPLSPHFLALSIFRYRAIGKRFDSFPFAYFPRTLLPVANRAFSGVTKYKMSKEGAVGRFAERGGRVGDAGLKDVCAVHDWEICHARLKGKNTIFAESIFCETLNTEMT